MIPLSERLSSRVHGGEFLDGGWMWAKIWRRRNEERGEDGGKEEEGGQERGREKKAGKKSKEQFQILIENHPILTLRVVKTKVCCYHMLSWELRLSYFYHQALC